MLVEVGLVLLWKKEVDFKVLCYSNLDIHGGRERTSSLWEWILTGVYKNPKVERRRKL